MSKRQRRKRISLPIAASMLAGSLLTATAARAFDAAELFDSLDSPCAGALEGGPGVGSRFFQPDDVWALAGGIAAAPERAGFEPWGPALPLSPLAFGFDPDPLLAPSGPVPPSRTRSWLGWVPSIALLGALAAAQAGLDPPEDSRWKDRNGFDDEIRSALKGESRGARKAGDYASSALFGGLSLLLVADWWWLREEYGVLESLRVDSRWVLATNLSTRVAKVSAGRERPYVRPCRDDSDYVSACGGGSDRNASFFSAHASNAATVAGLICARHLHRQSPGTSDALLCGGAVAGALATGILRLVAERHFATDVLAGWVTGAFFGYALPSRFDYRGDPPGPFSPRSFTPVIGREFIGLRWAFRF